MNFLFSFSRIKVRIFFTILCVLCIPRFDFKEGCSKRGGSHFFLPFAFRSVPQKGTFGKGEKKSMVSATSIWRRGGVEYFPLYLLLTFLWERKGWRGQKVFLLLGGSHDNFFIVRGFIALTQARERRSRRKGKKFLVGKERVRKVHRKRKKNGEEEGRRTVWGGTIIYFLSPHPSLHTAGKKERKSPPALSSTCIMVQEGHGVEFTN